MILHFHNKVNGGKTYVSKEMVMVIGQLVCKMVKDGKEDIKGKGGGQE